MEIQLASGVISLAKRCITPQILGEVLLTGQRTTFSDCLGSLRPSERSGTELKSAKMKCSEVERAESGESVTGAGGTVQMLGATAERKCRLGEATGKKLRKNWKRKRMKFTLRAMKTYPSAQPLGFFDVELRVPWLEAKI